MAKTDWQLGDTVLPEDLNQLGQEINDNASAIAAHVTATTDVHDATPAATANRIVLRDADGRAKVAAPAASDDIARKDTVDAVQTNLNTHKSSTTLDHPDGSVTTAKLADGAVTAAKLASGAVTSAKLASGAATDTVIGNRTITDTSAPSSDSGTLTNLLSWLGYMIKAITGKSSWRTAPATTLEAAAAHIANTNNPHGVTKSQVGLGSVQNYGIASQAQAEAGSASNVYMTPQRTKQYVDTRLQNNISFRTNSGVVEYYDGSGWKSVAGFDPTSMTVNTINGYVGSISLSAGQSVNIFSLSGAGVLGQLELAVSGSEGDRIGISLIVDGVEKPLYSQDGNIARTIAKAGYRNVSDNNTFISPTVIELFTPIKYSSSLVVRARNLPTISSSTTGWGFKGVYYT